MQSLICFFAFSILLSSVLSDLGYNPAPPRYHFVELDGLYLMSTTRTIQCRGQFPYQKTFREIPISNPTLLHESMRACTLRARTRPISNPQCPPAALPLKRIVDRLNPIKYPLLSSPAEQKSPTTEEYTGPELYAKFGGELIMSKIPNSAENRDDIVDKNVVVEWIPCLKVCRNVGAVYDEAAVDPIINPTTTNHVRIYRKCQGSSLYRQPSNVRNRHQKIGNYQQP